MGDQVSGDSEENQADAASHVARLSPELESGRKPAPPGSEGCTLVAVIDIFSILFVVVLIDGVRTGVVSPKEAIVWGVSYVVLRTCAGAFGDLALVFGSLSALLAIIFLIRVYGSNLISHY